MARWNRQSAKIGTLKVDGHLTMQASFSELEYAANKKVTRRDRFLGEINAVTPWTVLVGEVTPFAPKGEGCGHPPIGVERMLRMYIAQQCFGLSDEGIEDAIYDSQAIRAFVGFDLSHDSAPDATTLVKFRSLLEEHKLTERIFAAINSLLAVKGLMLKEGTVVDATIIAAPSSTKNQSGERDPEMHQTKKGNQWYFWHEGAYWRRCRHGHHSYAGDHGGQCGRRDASACFAARAGNQRLWGRGLSGRPEARQQR